MLKGSEVAFKLKDIDCHPKLKDVIVEQQQEIYFLRNQLTELASMFNMMVDEMTKITNGVNNLGLEFQKQSKGVAKALKHDEENEN